MQTQEKSIPEVCQTLTSYVQDFHARVSQSLEEDLDLKTMQEELSSLKLPESLNRNNLHFYCWKTYRDCYRMTKAGRLIPSSPVLLSWGMISNGVCLTAKISVSHSKGKGYSLLDFIVGFHCDGCAGKIFPLTTYDSKTMQQLVPGSQGYRIYSADGIACTQCADAGGLGAKTGLYLFVDMNPDPQLTNYARCITARQDAGISHRKGEHSGVMELVDDSKNNKQVVVVKDKSGNVYLATIRRLMPIECWRLQGFTDEQFYKAQSTGLKDNYLYKMAGNAVTVNVISEIGKKLKMINIEKGIVRSEE